MKVLLNLSAHSVATLGEWWSVQGMRFVERPDGSLDIEATADLGRTVRRDLPGQALFADPAPDPKQERIA